MIHNIYGRYEFRKLEEMMKVKKVEDEEIKKVHNTKLARGMGTMFVNKDQTYIVYKRSIEKNQVVVRDVTVKKVLEKMKQKEKEISNRKKNQDKTMLSDALYEWIFLEKKKVLKASTREI